MRAPRRCQRCERVRRIHAFELCDACYQTLLRRKWLPTKLPTGYLPCRRCGVVPRTLHYRHPANYRMPHGLCHACALRDYRQRRKARNMALEQAS